MNLGLQLIEKYKYFLLSLIIFSASILFINSHRTIPFDQSEFQRAFNQKENQLKDFVARQKESLGIKSIPFATSDFYVYKYKSDSLIYWNSNELPISKYVSIQFPANGLLHLQNGWYYCKTIEYEDEILCAAFEIKKEYSYENEFLVNHTNPELTASDFDISLDPAVGSPIKNIDKKFVFSAIPTKEAKANSQSPFTIISLIIGLLVFIYGCYDRCENSVKKTAVFLISLLAFRLLLYQIDFAPIFNNAKFLSADLFAYNEWFPSFLDLCINIIFIAFAVLALVQLLHKLQVKLVVWLHIPLLFALWWLILKTMNLVILNSTIPLNLENLFQLDSYSFLILLLFGVIFSVYQHLVQNLLIAIKIQQVKIGVFVSFFFVSGILFAIYRISLNDEYIIPLILPILLLFANFFFQNKQKFGQKLGFQLLILGLFSASFVSDLNQHNSSKDKETRILYGNQLAVEQDVNLELEFGNIKTKLLSDPLIQSTIRTTQPNLSVSDFGDILEKRHFKGLWEGYEMSFNLFDSVGVSLLTKEAQGLEPVLKIIERNGEVSQINPSIYFIRDAISGYNYIIRLEVKVGGKKAELFITLKSKRIPEEIGFPRLLLSEKSKVLTSLEKYSIAKYTSNKLIKHYGDYNFPTFLRAFPTPSENATFFDFDGYNHYYFKKNNKAVIILSSQNKTWLELVTSFSYVFSFWGLLLLFSSLLLGSKFIANNSFTLAFKIQFVLVMLVVLALLLFGTGSGIFVGQQYQTFTDRIINEKLHSVEEELRGKVANYKGLDAEDNGNYLESVLMKLSKVFVTDLNIYDPNGYLIASSRPKIFNIGLLGEQINPQALEELKLNNKSFFSNREEIGKLSYISSYLPFYNGEGKMLGYINLQHFGQQRDFEDQIQQFIVAIINVFILLLAISIIISLLISNWLTAPLRLLSQKVATLKFGIENQKIAYDGNDEIGTIVKAYNLKLEELEEAALQLAKSERESAWREMAKQVAHEIKNPLTPMKLGIQHLLRSYDPSNEGSKERLERVLNSVIEQIDGLTRIANEFSNFAKMPDPQKVEIDLLGIISNSATLFEMEENCTIEIHSEESLLLLKIDKDQWIQVFNNLIKNAIQSLNERKDGKVSISVKKRQETNQIVIQVSDNGTGIPNEQKDKIFIPHFTTKSTGSGIGLSVVKQIVENHGGKISFESIENEGTTFTIVLNLN
jgi:signal transduction histidine kinase